MAENTVAVYQWNEDKVFVGIRMKGVDEPLRDNETLVKPEDGLYTPIKWDGSTWVGTPKEVWEANQSKVEVKPTAQQTAMASLMKDVASMKTSDQTQNSLNASVMKDLAQAKIQLQQQAQINASLMKDIADLKNAKATN